MTSHVRKLFRQAIVTILATGSTLAEDRVTDNPNDPRMEFPALTVVDGGEQQVAKTLAVGRSVTLERTCVFVISAEVQQNDDPAGARDDLIAQVETLLAVANVPGIKAILPTGYSADIEHRGQHPILVGRQAFTVLYYTSAGDPTTTL